MNQIEKNKLSISAKIILADVGISKIIHIFLDTFLAAYLYKITQQSIYYLSVYNMFVWVAATITAFSISNYIKTKNKIKIYQIGIFSKALFVLIIMLLGENIINYIFLIGIMFGIIVAMTGYPLNMIESENISKKESIKYFSANAIIQEFVSVFVPILLGAYISLNSYKAAGIFIFIFSAIEFIVVLKLKNQNHQSEKVKIKEFYKNNKNNIYLKKLYIIEFFKGLTRNGVMNLIVTMLIIYNTKNEFSVGKFTSLFSIVTIFTMFLFGKFYNKKIKNRLLLICFLGLSIGCFLIIINTNMITILIYNVSYYALMNIIVKITQVNLFNYSNEELFKTTYNTEYFLARELFLNLGRLFGYLMLLIFVGLTKNMNNLNIIFLLMLICIGIISYISSTLKTSDKPLIKSAVEEVI